MIKQHYTHTTARQILIDKASEFHDGFMTGQEKWILEAMEEYGEYKKNEGYGEGYKDATKEAQEEIAKNYQPNR